MNSYHPWLFCLCQTKDLNCAPINTLNLHKHTPYFPNQGSRANITLTADESVSRDDLQHPHSDVKFNAKKMGNYS